MKPSSSSSLRGDAEEERLRIMGLESKSSCWIGGGEENCGKRGGVLEFFPPKIRQRFGFFKSLHTMRAGAELGRHASVSFVWPLLKERIRDRDTGLVGFLNSKLS